MTAPSTGLSAVDSLASLGDPGIDDYLFAVSAYVRNRSILTDGQAKSAQIGLSAGLARVLRADLLPLIPHARLVAGERAVAGALRTAQADLSELTLEDGLRIGVELKPINLAVGRAIWNRFGDIRTFSVNLHIKFPFAVVGGVIAVPTYEERRRKDGTIATRSTVHLIDRLVDRLARAGGRRTEGDASHLLEAVAVIVYDPLTAQLDPGRPASGTGLRWEEFAPALAKAYLARFEVP